MNAAKRAEIEKLREFDPAHTPDQRWVDACRAVDEGRRVSTGLHPEPVVEAFNYLRALRRCRDDRDREKVVRRWPELHAARLLAEAGGEHRWEIESRLLADQSDDEIAERTGLTAGAIGRFETLFFNVRARLAACDWVLTRAIWCGHSLSISMPDLGVVWKSVAYFGGPMVLEVMLSATLDRPFPASIDQGMHGVDPGHAERLRMRARLLAEVMMLPADASLGDLTRLQGVLHELKGSRPARPGSIGVAERVMRSSEGAEFRRPAPAYDRLTRVAGA
jgi:hypothetical protein